MSNNDNTANAWQQSTSRPTGTRRKAANKKKKTTPAWFWVLFAVFAVGIGAYELIPGGDPSILNTPTVHGTTDEVQGYQPDTLIDQQLPVEDLTQIDENTQTQPEEEPAPEPQAEEPPVESEPTAAPSAPEPAQQSQSKPATKPQPKAQPKAKEPADPNAGVLEPGGGE